MFEKNPIDNAIRNKNLVAYRHSDFWQCVDTKRDYENLIKVFDKHFGHFVTLYR